MSIYARTLSVTEYRSFPSFELDLARGVTVLVGHNAVGKTNIIEGIQLLTAQASFRNPTAAQMIRQEAGDEMYVRSTSVLGVDPMHVEAMAFAWLAWAFLNRIPGNLPEVTNATGSRILGALYPH